MCDNLEPVQFKVIFFYSVIIDMGPLSFERESLFLNQRSSGLVFRQASQCRNGLQFWNFSSHFTYHLGHSGEVGEESPFVRKRKTG